MMTHSNARQRSLAECQFPRILGIEAVGLVGECPGSEFKRGVVATAMGGMGRDFSM